MPRKLYVGNLTKDVTEKDIKELFAEYGKVESVEILRDKDSQETLGYGFVEMDANQANDARIALNGHELKGIFIIVKKARMRRNISMGESRPKGKRKHVW